MGTKVRHTVWNTMIDTFDEEILRLTRETLELESTYLHDAVLGTEVRHTVWNTMIDTFDEEMLRLTRETLELESTYLNDAVFGTKVPYETLWLTHLTKKC